MAAPPKPAANLLKLANGSLTKNPKNRSAAEKRAIRLTKAWRDYQKRAGAPARPGATPPAQAPNAPPADPFAGLNSLGPAPTLEQFTGQAGQLAQAQLQPSMQEIARLQEQAIRNAEQQASLAGGLAQALGPMTANIGPQIQQQYQQAAQTQAGLAQGFSQNLQGIAEQEAAANAQILNQSGAPQAQVEQTQAQSQGASDPLYGTGGFIPSTALGQQGAAFAAYGSTMPAVVARMGQQDAASARAAGAQASGDLQRQAADLQAQLPGLTHQMALDLLQNAQANYENERAFQFELAATKQDQARWKAEFKAQLTEQRRQYNLQKQAAKAAAQAAGLNMKMWNAEQKRADREFDAAQRQQAIENGFTERELGLRESDFFASQQGGGLTPYQQANRADKAAAAKAKAKASLGETLREQAEKLVVYREGLQPGSKKRDRARTPPYKEAMARLRKIYAVEIAALRKKGVTQKTITQMIRGALLAAGWKEPPKPTSNRPLVPGMGNPFSYLNR